MIFIKTNDDELVIQTHFMPFDAVYGLKKTEAELLKEGYLVEDIPEPELPNGKVAVLMYNQTTGFYFVYEDEPVIRNTVEEEIEEIKQENELLKAQNKAMSERADFVEDLVAELAIQVYQ